MVTDFESDEYNEYPLYPDVENLNESPDLRICREVIDEVLNAKVLLQSISMERKPEFTLLNTYIFDGNKDEYAEVRAKMFFLGSVRPLCGTMSSISFDEENNVWSVTRHEKVVLFNDGHTFDPWYASETVNKEAHKLGPDVINPFDFVRSTTLVKESSTCLKQSVVFGDSSDDLRAARQFQKDCNLYYSGYKCESEIHQYTSGCTEVKVDIITEDEFKTLADFYSLCRFVFPTRTVRVEIKSYPGQPHIMVYHFFGPEWSESDAWNGYKDLIDDGYPPAALSVFLEEPKSRGEWALKIDYSYPAIHLNPMNNKNKILN